MPNDVMCRPAPQYSLIDSPDTEQWLVKIEEGDYKDVTFKYNTVKIREENDADGNCVLQFTYDIIYDAEMTEHVKPTCVDFVNTIGDILFNMIVDHDETKEKK